jgi:hypothetical protein
MEEQGTTQTLTNARVTLQLVGLLEQVVHDQARQHYRAFFSSVLGGITTNPALMTVHIDDHMVHRSVQWHHHCGHFPSTLARKTQGSGMQPCE